MIGEDNGEGERDGIVIGEDDKEEEDDREDDGIVIGEDDGDGIVIGEERDCVVICEDDGDGIVIGEEERELDISESSAYLSFIPCNTDIIVCLDRIRSDENNTSKLSSTFSFSIINNFLPVLYA